ncbi:MAG: MBL fold metallo-hydrolase, partial [Halobacteriovoraceae bacterium]|nr:MBL fold metallo-hydrolase [Halobacteriovoraceae bacterium]
MGSISAMEIKEFFDKNTSTFSYIIYDKQTRDGVVLDSVLDYDPNSSSVTRDSLDKITQFLNQ